MIIIKGHKRVSSSIINNVNYSNMSNYNISNSKVNNSQIHVSQLSKGPKSARKQTITPDKPKQNYQVFKPIIEKGGKMNIKNNYNHK